MYKSDLYSILSNDVRSAKYYYNVKWTNENLKECKYFLKYYVVRLTLKCELCG